LRKYVSAAQALEADEKKRRLEEEGHAADEIVISSGIAVPSSKIQRHVKRHKTAASLATGMILLLIGNFYDVTADPEPFRYDGDGHSCPFIGDEQGSAGCQ